MDRPDPSDALTIPEVAEVLRTSENTVRRRIASGELFAIDISPRGAWKTKLRVLRSDLDTYLKARKITVPTP